MFTSTGGRKCLYEMSWQFIQWFMKLAWTPEPTNQHSDTTPNAK